jgi:hypothetical protein
MATKADIKGVINLAVSRDKRPDYPTTRYPAPPVRPLGVGNNPNRQTPARPAVAVKKATGLATNLPLIGPAPGAKPAVWTPWLQEFDYMPVLRNVNPTVRIDPNTPALGTPFWQPGFATGPRNAAGTLLNASQSQRGDETVSKFPVHFLSFTHFVSFIVPV